MHYSTGERFGKRPKGWRYPWWEWQDLLDWHADVLGKGAWTMRPNQPAIYTKLI
jgi:hypothetical protein